MRARSAKVVTGEQGMIGMIGVARSALTPQGKVFVNGELWNAIALAPIKSGQSVRVRSVHGLTVEVEPEASQPEAPLAG
jgi:membrane-bound serine protease (ClpP class)